MSSEVKMSCKEMFILRLFLTFDIGFAEAMSTLHVVANPQHVHTHLVDLEILHHTPLKGTYFSMTADIACFAASGSIVEATGPASPNTSPPSSSDDSWLRDPASILFMFSTQKLRARFAAV